MWDTRKQIINLIKDYMDKTLCEGCLLKVFGYKELDIIIKDEFYNINDEENIYIPTYYSCNTIEAKYKREWYKEEKWVIDQIIGHYDITAVLKYIWNHDWNFQQTYEDDFIWMTWRTLKMSKSDIRIPNKPLNLYSVDEEKELLELLSNLQKDE
jgi:hypothetical protein